MHPTNTTTIQSCIYHHLGVSGTAWMWLAQTGQCVQVFAGHDGGR